MTATSCHDRRARRVRAHPEAVAGTPGAGAAGPGGPPMTPRKPPRAWMAHAAQRLQERGEAACLVHRRERGRRCGALV